VSSEEASGQHIGRDIELGEIMQPVKTVTPSTTEREALAVLLESRTPGVPVVDEEGLLVGFVTDGHLLSSVLPAYLKVINDVSFVSEAGDEWVDYFAGVAERPVGEVMSTEVSSVEVGTSEVVAAHKMVREGVSSVVVTHHGRVVGIVNRLDLFGAIVDASPSD
jgi:CBS domain-containing protein